MTGLAPWRPMPHPLVLNGPQCAAQARQPLARLFKRLLLPG